MGKKKKGVVCNNPIAMARASGHVPVTGPTIRDYLNRDRPSLNHDVSTRARLEHLVETAREYNFMLKVLCPASLSFVNKKGNISALDEAAIIIASQYGKRPSGALSVFDEQMNDRYRKELKKRREKLLGAATKKSSSDRRRSKEKKARKKSKKRKKHRDRSRSRSSSPTSFTGDKEKHASGKDIHSQPSVPASEDHNPFAACGLTESSPEPEET